MMKTLTTPWKDDLIELVSKANKTIKITSPFIKDNICSELISAKSINTKIEIITSFKLMNIYSGSLDISAIERIIDNNGVVKNFHKLHSKIYLFDDEKAIISSGNLTNGGLLSNFEYGILINEISFVSQVVSDYNFLSNHENTGEINKSNVDDVRKILSSIPQTENTYLRNLELETPEEKYDILNIPRDIIMSSLNGWKLEVFKCASLIEKQSFSLSEINQFENHLKEIFPNNFHILDKIRQQLQYLRDLGLLEFMGNGIYKKLWI